ncbi:MAG: ROK family protein [Tissierellia bacterium]|nr:ROK family protein [Tissierellia bacterium]
MKNVIGVDLGGTKINAGIVDPKGNILKSTEIETHADKGRDTVIKRITMAIEEIIDEDIVGIGITSPGFINSDEGIVEFAGNIKDWTGLNMHEVFKDIFPGKILKIQNDANMAAICEKWIGAAKDLDSFVMLTLGTGLGGAIYHDAMGLWEGSRYQGAELGHSILYPKGRLCTCGQSGCSEKYIAGSALSINYFELTGLEKSGPEIISSLKNDDKAMKSLSKYTDDLATFLVSLTNTFDPQGIILGGGFINSREYWWSDLLNKYEDLCNRPENIKILPAQFLNDSGIIGVAKTVFDEL